MSRLRRTPAVLALTVAAMGLMVATGTGPASAAYSPCSPAGDYSTGYATNDSTQTVEGVSSFQTIYAGVECTGTGTNKVDRGDVFVLGGNLSHDGEVTSGFLNINGGCNLEYASAVKNSTDTVTQIDGSVCQFNGAKLTNRVLFDTTCDCYDANQGTTTLIQTSWDPYGLWSTPFRVGFEGWVNYYSSDMPGTPLERDEFTSEGYQRFAGDNVVNACGDTFYTFNNSVRQSTHGVSCNDSQVWNVRTGP